MPSNALAIAAAALLKTLRGTRGIAAESVTYTRGASSCTLLASLGRTQFQNMSAESADITASSVDFLVTAEDLKFGGTLVTPQANDRIEHDGLQYRVSVFGDNCYSYSDPSRLSIRIHTTRI